MKKSSLLTIIIIVVVLIIAYFALKGSSPQTDEEVAKCIGKNSVLYIQLGCHACEIQKEMFGDNYKYLNKVDCFYEKGNCPGIEATPTWEIKGERYRGVQSIEKLKELTGC